MEHIVLLIVFLLFSYLVSEKKEKSYKNIHTMIAAIITAAICLIVTIIIELVSGTTLINSIVIELVFIGLIVICKLVVKNLCKYDGQTVPYRYLNGAIGEILDVFYERKQFSFLLKPKFRFLKNMLLVAVATEILFLVIAYINTGSINESILVRMCITIVVFFEIALFLCGKTEMSIIEDRYKALEDCDTSAEFLSAKYNYPDSYEYIFRKNNKAEKSHLIHSTINNYKLNKNDNATIRIYDFNEKKYSVFEDYVQNDILNEFVKANKLEINPLYVQVFSLLDRRSNVLMHSSSYADFDPYLAALIKKFSSETYKTVVVVDTEESGNGFINRYTRIFNEYFGLSPIPIIRSFRDIVALEHEKLNKKVQAESCFDEEIKESFGEVLPNSSCTDTGTDVIVLSPEDVIDSCNSDILRKLSSDISFIIYYDFSECVHEETLFCKIVHSVLDPDDKISTLYMSDGFFDFKQAINNFFSIRPFYEVTIPRRISEKSYCSVWKYENAMEMQERSIINPSIDFGMHPVLATFASNYLNNNCMIIADENDIYAETFAKFSSTSSVSNKMDCYVGWKDIVDGNHVYCSVTDRYNNIPHTYLAIRGVGHKQEYVNIVSKPYLLREYLAYFSKFFSTVPDALTSFSAAIINTPRAAALECVIKSYLVGCTREQIKNYAIKITANNFCAPEEMLRAMIDELKFDCCADNLIVTKIDERYYINKELYDEIISKTGFVDKVHFVVNNQEIIRYKKDFNYLVPMQKLALDGRKYTVVDINDDYVELSDSQAREAVYSTRLVRECSATSTSVKNTFSYVSNNSRASMQISNILCELEVKTKGRISFKDDYSFDESRRMNNYLYTSADTDFVRNYKEANILKVKFKFPEDITSDNRNFMAHTMALLINEMLPTFFPKHSERIIVACTGWNNSIPDNPEKVNLDHIVASFKIEDNICDDEFCIYMFEDSQIETGVVNVFWQDEELRYMFNILEDYLYYLEVVDRETKSHLFGDGLEKPLHELRKALLHLIDHPMENSIAEYANVIRRTRDTFFEKRLNNTHFMKCDFCGKPIKGDASSNYKFYHYSGKQSCSKCASTAVNTEDLPKMNFCIGKVYEWIEKSYKTRPEGPSLCILEDAEFINKLGRPDELYAVTDDQDDGISAIALLNDVPASVDTGYDEELMLRVMSGFSGDRTHEGSVDCEDWTRLGYFVDNANIIAVQNGLPQFEYESTLAHELTHQWQYEQLDDSLLLQEPYPATVKNQFEQVIDMTPFRIEGHSSWVEWKYLKKHGHFVEAAKLKRSLMNRNDEYGIGFRWFRNLIRVGGSDKYSVIKRSLIFKLKRLFYQIAKNPYAIMKLYYGKAKAKNVKDNVENTDNNEFLEELTQMENQTVEKTSE